MVMQVQISCINKRQHQNPHERITHVGGVHNDKVWKLPEAAAIQGIKDGTYDFWTSVNGKGIRVIVAAHNGREYLKTEPDGYAPNNLLSLPECP